jgi:hypothetical protein
MEMTEQLLRKKRTEEEEELFKKRKSIKDKINRLYNRLGTETYGHDNFATSLASAEKKKGKILFFILCFINLIYLL